MSACSKAFPNDRSNKVPRNIIQLPEWIASSFGDIDETMPPGLSESDWKLPQLPTTQLHDPAEHPGHHRLRDVESIFEPLDISADDQPWPGLPVRGEALDRLAWYKSFRHGSSWGIYIREAAALSLSRFIASSRRPAGPDSRRVAWTALYFHEYGHFLFDVAARTMEDIVQADLYEPHRREVTGRPPGWHAEEEALCNALSYRVTPATGYRQNLRTFMRAQPSGYRDFPNYLADPDFDNGIEVVLGQMLRGFAGARASGTRALFDDTDDGRVTPAMVPVYVVHESDDPALFHLITALGAVEQSKAFNKDLRALPRDVRNAWEERVLPALHTDVRTAGHFKKLQGRDNEYSVRIHGTYRAILQREGGDRWTVLSIDHRREAYR